MYSCRLKAKEKEEVQESREVPEHGDPKVIKIDFRIYRTGQLFINFLSNIIFENNRDNSKRTNDQNQDDA